MDKPKDERRKMSHGGMIDAIIQTIGQLASSNDLMTRSLANRALADLRKLRSQLPTRRAMDRRATSR